MRIDFNWRFKDLQGLIHLRVTDRFREKPYYIKNIEEISFSYPFMLYKLLLFTSGLYGILT